VVPLASSRALGVTPGPELQEEIVEAYRVAITTGDAEALRRAEAAEKLLSRCFGRPKESITVEEPAKPAYQREIEAMSPEQRRTIWRNLNSGQDVDAPAAQ
jgi:hypothetical protein